MIADIQTYLPQFSRIFAGRNPQLSNVKPSVFAERNIIVPGKGYTNYDFNPYARGIIDCFAPDHPAKKIAVKKGSQITISSGVIMPLLGYTIKEYPRNTYLMVGTEDLIKPAVEKLDHMIHGANLKDYIGYQIKRKTNNKTGYTDEIKYFANGYIKIGSASNPKSIAQVDLSLILLDDFDAMKGRTKVGGALMDLIEMRAASNLNDYKLGMFSTPLLKGESNIDEAFNMGNQQYYFVECPCCHEPIIFKWEVKENDIINKLKDEKALCDGGIVYELNKLGQVDKKSVGYVCYRCGGWFNDRNKQKMIREAYWEATAIPQTEDFYSFQIPSLYAPFGMYDWYYYATKHLAANPVGQPRDEHRHQVLMNTCWGESYEARTEAPEATSIMKNQRDYAPGIVPEQMSIDDGNGHIVMLTCGADMNGRIRGMHNSEVDDARLDYEVLAHSESGATYSILHGSIGTFIPREGNNKADRVKWTYEHNAPYSVWPEFEKLLQRKFKTDTGREIPITLTGLDIGFGAAIGAYPFLDKHAGTGLRVVGVKGEKEEKMQLLDRDVRMFKKSLERPLDCYTLQVNYIKNKLSEYMNLRWAQGKEHQPPHFMNYPQGVEGLYQYNNYFKHYEAEIRKPVEDKDGAMMFRWEKKDAVVQNHMWDCFDESTEILTKNGWKHFKDLRYSDSVATVNLNTDSIEYQTPTHIIKKEYSGEMVSIDGKRVNAVVTPTHRMVVYRKKWDSNCNSGRMQNKPEIVFAKDLRVTDCIKVASNWHSQGDEFYTIPETIDSMGRVISRAVCIPSKIWGAFLGLYIAEGSKTKSYNDKRKSWAHRVLIHQNKGVKQDKIADLLSQLPFKVNLYKSNGNCDVFTITSKQLYNELEKYGDSCYNKASGNWIKEQSAETISAFLEYAILGDGYRNPKGGHIKYYTVSEHLANDIQELFIKAGYQSNISIIAPKTCKLNGSTNTVVQYHISANKTTHAALRLSDNQKIFKPVDYNGMVYCATVPNGTLICRREGKSFIAGNCRVYNIALREIALMRVAAVYKRKELTWQEYAAAIVQAIKK